MIHLQTDLEGKQAYYGKVKDMFTEQGFVLGGNWDYYNGCFDSILSREGGETIYLRLPFRVIAGALDEDGAHLEFQTPLIVKHVVNEGIETEDNSLLTATGFNQFQEPLDLDGQIKNDDKWKEAGEEVVRKISGYIDAL